MSALRPRSPTRPYDNAVELHEVINGLPFLLYDVRYGIIKTAYFIRPPNIVDVFEPTVFSTNEKSAVPNSTVGRNGHRPATSLGLCSDKDGFWDAYQFCVHAYKTYEDRYLDFIEWLRDREPFDPAARTALRQLGFDDPDAYTDREDEDDHDQ